MSVLFRSTLHLQRFSIPTVLRVSSVAQTQFCQNQHGITKRSPYQDNFGQSSFLHTHLNTKTNLRIKNCGYNLTYLCKRHCSQVSNSSSSDSSAESLSSDSSLISSETLLSNIDTSNIVTQLAEPTLASQGLGSYWPPGLVQHTLQFFHVDLGLPWWASIVTLTVIIRMLIFPLYVAARKNAIHMHNDIPKTLKVQQEMVKAARSGDHERMLEAQFDVLESTNSTFKMMRVQMAQVPIFISMFWGLRPMANLPIESMKTGGALWFPDLTVVEYFYGLPLLTTLTLIAVIQVGGDTDYKSQPHGEKIMRTLQGGTLLMWPVFCNFPTAMLVYWLTSNTITLLQVALFQVPSVQKAFNFPEKKTHVIDITANQNRKSFMEQYRETVNNEKLKHAQFIVDQKRLDALEAEKKRVAERIAYTRKLEALKMSGRNKRNLRSDSKDSLESDPSNRRQNK